MRNSIVLYLLYALFVLPLYAADFDALLIDAVRYANTPEKHAAKVAARAELKEHMPESFHAAMQYADGDNVMLQVLVMEWVRELPSETVVPALLEFVDHEREDTRRLAIFFLGFHDTPEHADRIVPYLEDERCRGSTIRTLGKWKVASARPDIEKWLTDGKERMRVVAANALRDLGDPAAIHALINALDDPIFTVRNTAARALISFDNESIKNLHFDFPEKSQTFEKMRQRCLADLGVIPNAEVLPEGTKADGLFFVP